MKNTIIAILVLANAFALFVAWQMNAELEDFSIHVTHMSRDFDDIMLFSKFRMNAPADQVTKMGYLSLRGDKDVILGNFEMKVTGAQENYYHWANVEIDSLCSEAKTRINQKRNKP